MSRAYCEDEFVLDTNHLLSMLEEVNNSEQLDDDSCNLFTLDVEKLYPSIQPNLAMEAINDLLSDVNEEDSNSAEAVKSYIKLSFEESYVTFKNQVYKPKVGIPTGGSLSRQVADVFLHWLLFKKIDQSIFNRRELKFWKRFIDDGVGIWKGRKRSFDAFVKKLNKETNKYGINFPISDIQFGKSVSYLDITIYFDEENRIQYRSYTKPTDAKRFLQPSSFHPNNVFNSVPYSQMKRTIQHNSTKENCEKEMKELMNNFEKSGYKRENLEQIEEKVINETNTVKNNYNNNNNNNNNNNQQQPTEEGELTEEQLAEIFNSSNDQTFLGFEEEIPGENNNNDNNHERSNSVNDEDDGDNNNNNNNNNNTDEEGNEADTNEETSVLTFPLHHFEQLDEFKQILRDARDDLTTLIGNTKVIWAVKKNPSIGNMTIRNKELSRETITFTNQKCNGIGCKQCPLVNTEDVLTVNNKRVKATPKNLNCKSRNVIYLWQCQLCTANNSYFGRTVQVTHKRTNTHRGCFDMEGAWEDSALSMHAKSCHPDNFSLKNFKISLVQQCTPQTIRRNEFKFIDKYKTRVRGLNRYKNLTDHLVVDYNFSLV